MISFQLKPKLQKFSSFEEFAREAALGPDDVVLTHRFLHTAFMQKLSCQTLFYEDYCTGEPSNVIIDAMLEAVGKMEYSRMIAVGGGAVLDSSKLLTIDGATNTERLFNDATPQTRSRGLIMVPTTCGTGCEVTGVAVIDFPAKGTKIGKRFECSFADTAVLIGELVRGLPYDQFIYSSMDALIHALEIYVAPTASEYSDLFCEKAIRKILGGYAELLKHGPEKRYELLDSFLTASNLAGIALANVLCGAVHAMAMHFGSAHHVPHGESNSRFLMGVFSAYAAKNPDGKLKGVTRIVSECLGTADDTHAAFGALNDLFTALVPQKKLTDYGMKREDAGAYADKVIETQQRLLVNNYVPLDREDIIAIYESAC